MNSNPAPRRQFFKQLSVGVIGLPAVSGLLSAQKAFGEELARRGLSGLTASTLPQLRREYMLAADVTYLNHASIGTIPRIVHEARSRYLKLCESNPWLYMWGGEWEEPRETVRGKTAGLLGCKSGEVALTHNTTEAFNLLAHGLSLGPGDEVVFSSLNHVGASAAWHHVAEKKGFRVKQFQFPTLDVPKMSRDDVLNAYDEQISPNTRVLVFPHIDNSVGLRHPVRELSKLARERGVEFVAVDAAQSVGMIPVDVAQAGVDVYATSPHKWLQAPKGVGLMYVRQEIQGAIRPLWVTWGQERWQGSARIFEDYGTRNLPEVLTLGNAIDFQLRLNPQEREQRLRSLWEFTRTKAAETEGVIWRSPSLWELSASLYAVEVEGKESQALFDSLYHKHGFVFRPFNAQGLNSVRLSPNVFTTENEIARFFELATGT